MTEHTSTTLTDATRSELRSGKQRKWTEARELALEGITEASAYIIGRGIWLMCFACMRDSTGRQIDHQLEACRPEFAAAVYAMCLREHWSGYGRTWESWRARRLATLALLLAHLSRPAAYHGELAWMVRGIPRGALVVATCLRTLVHGVALKVEPHLNTVYTDLLELERAGLIHPPAQFAWWKVPAWARGQKRADGTQWAFMHYFLRIQPFEAGPPTKIFRAPKGAIMHASKPRRVLVPARDEAPIPSRTELDRLDAELAKLDRELSTGGGCDDMPADDDAIATERAKREALAMIALFTSRGPPTRH